MNLIEHRLDVRADQRVLILELLQTYLPDTEVWAYGSRVNQTSKPASDLDLVAFTQHKQKAAVSDLREAFEESNLPFRVDFFEWNDIPESFQQQIKAKYVVLQNENR